MKRKRVRPRLPGPPIVDSRTPYELDVAAQLFVATFPFGASLSEVGLAMGLTNERVRQIEGTAMRKFKQRLRWFKEVIEWCKENAA